jgi:hypothetical protein
MSLFEKQATWLSLPDEISVKVLTSSPNHPSFLEQKLSQLPVTCLYGCTHIIINKTIPPRVLLGFVAFHKYLQYNNIEHDKLLNVRH